MKLTIEIDTGQGFATGNLLNSIDEIVCAYQAKTLISEDQISDALNMYAQYVMEPWGKNDQG